MQNSLQQTYYRTAAISILQREELKKVLLHLREHHIPVILHKGIALVETVYKNPALRPMVDVDLIVPFDKLSETEACLKSFPFRSDLLFLDLHTDIINTKRFGLLQKKPSARIMKMWQRAQKLDFEGIPTLVLSPEDFLIALCFHLAFNHRLCGPLWFSDIAHFLECYKDKLNWAELVQLAQDYENAKSVFYCLKYLNEKQCVAIPREALNKLSPKKTSLMERTLVGRIWKEKPLGRFGFFFSLSLIENQKMRRRYLWLTLTTPR
ncbi:MAG: nucleotidyltransferase family protein [Deltaproteobacteria bacterium]|nr:nucleotidyltransferase family protein [Deltaproteobacteria bacterium]